MATIDAKRDTINEIVYLVTDAMGVPIIDRSRSACAVFESFLSEDAISYNICGPIPRGKRPRKVEYFTRVSRKGDAVPWEACNGDGCQGEEMRFQAETSTLCGRFRLWKGRGEHRDLMVKVTLSEN